MNLNEEVVTEGKQLDRLKKLGIIAGMTAFGAGVGIARNNTYTDKTGTQMVDGSAIPAGVTGAGGGALIGSLMARDMVASSKRNRDLKKHLKKSKETRDMKNEETLHELHKKTIQSFIKKRGEQAEIAAANSQTAKKAYLGNSRETGWRDPIVPRVVGQIGKIGQHDPALLRTATIFDQREKRAKESVRKATLRLSGKKTKESDTMKNEEYTQVLEQMILSLTGMKLEELHEAVVGHLTEMAQTRGRYLQVDPKATIADLKRDVQGRKERAGKPVIGMHGRVLARSAAAYYKKYPRARGTLHDSSTAGDDLSEDYQTPARNAQMQDMYDRAEGKFFNNLSSDKLLRKVRNIDNKNNAEQQSPRLYGKNGVQIKQTKKKRVRVGQPGGKQGGYQG